MFFQTYNQLYYYKIRVFLLFSFLCVSCASHNTLGRNLISSDNTSTIYLFRDKGFIGYFASYNTYLDNQYIGGLTSGGHLTINASPGNHVLTVQVLNTYETKLEIITKSNNTYEVKLEQEWMKTDPKINGKLVGMAASVNPNSSYKSKQILNDYLYFGLKLLKVTTSR